MKQFLPTMGIFGNLQRPVRIGVDVCARTLKAAWRTRRAGGRVEWRYVQCRRTQDTSSNSLPRDLAQLLRPLRRVLGWQWYQARLLSRHLPRRE